MRQQKCGSICKTSVSTRNRKSSRATVGAAAGRDSQAFAEEEHEPCIPVLKDGRGGAGREQVPESFSLDDGGGANRRRCRNSHRGLPGSPTRVDRHGPGRPTLRTLVPPQAATREGLGRAGRPAGRARRSDVTRALTSPAAAASEAGLGPGGAEFD